MKANMSVSVLLLLICVLVASNCTQASLTPISQETVSLSTVVPKPTITATLTPPPVDVKPSGWISFDSNQDGLWGIYLIAADGATEAQPLTVHVNGEYWSTWSPDGSRIAFSSFRNAIDAEGTSSIYTINLDGTSLRQVTDQTGNDIMPAWSPDGNMLAFASKRNSEDYDIYVVNVDGSQRRALTDDPAQDSWPSWSPDGKRITFDSNRSGTWQIYIANYDGSDIAQLTYDSVNGQSAWSPDGSKIAFISYRDENAEIYVMDADGKNATRLTQNSAKDEYPTWSPDGQYIAFASDLAGNRDLYVMRSDGSEVTQLTRDQASQYPPKWSPANVVMPEKPRFGIPYCLRDTDGDGISDTAVKEFPRSDEVFYISFPYGNMRKGLNWGAFLVSEEANPISYEANWTDDPSGIMTLQFGNMTGYEIASGPIHGAAIGPVPVGPMKVQLFIDGVLVQEIQCDIVKPEDIPK